MGGIIWQPFFGPKYDFSVNLDSSFAEKAINARVSLEKQMRMN